LKEKVKKKRKVENRLEEKTTKSWEGQILIKQNHIIEDE
jgi:hypothetical protein